MVVVTVTIVTVPMRHGCCNLCYCYFSHTCDQMVVVTFTIETVPIQPVVAVHVTVITVTPEIR